MRQRFLKEQAACGPRIRAGEAARLKAAYAKGPELLPTSLEENVIRRAEEFKKKATALDPSIRLEEISVFTYTKKNGDKSYRYWKCEWRSSNGNMKQAHLRPAEGKKGLSEDEALQKARRMKAEDLGINTTGRED